jgi:hypothetical protein
MDALKATPYEFDCVIVLTNHTGVDDATRATAWETYYNAVVTEAAECQSAGKPAFFVIPGTMPVATATSANIITWGTALATKGLTVTRNRQIVTVCGPGYKTNALGDKLVTYWQTPIFEVARKLCSEPITQDIGWRGKNNEYAIVMTPIYDEGAFGLLDDSSFVTTIFSNNQWFFSAGRTHSTEYGFKRIGNVRIANYLYRLSKLRLEAYLNYPVDRNSQTDVDDSQGTLILDCVTPDAALQINSDVASYCNAGVSGLLTEAVSFSVDQTYASEGLRGNVTFLPNKYVESITFSVVTR